jgi:hypothetical protein
MTVLGYGAFRTLEIGIFSSFELYWGLYRTSFRFSKWVDILIRTSSSLLNSDIKMGDEMVGFVLNASVSLM